MNNANENNIMRLIMACEFKQAYELVKSMPCDKLENLLLKIGFDNGQSIVVYAFVCYLIGQKNATDFHFIAQSVLCGPLCYIEGSYNLALCHNKLILDADKENIKSMTMMLFFSTLPAPLVSEKDAVAFAEKIIKATRKIPPPKIF